MTFSIGTGLDGLRGQPASRSETPEQRRQRLLALRTGEAGSVHSWELVTAVDGPGTRMTLFLAGCPLRCLYCHNPDTIQARNGTLVSLDEVVARLLRYRGVFRATGGGLTISGGEPLQQPAFVGKLLTRAKEHGIHTTIDTSGFLGKLCTDEMLGNLDLVLLDIKSGDPELYKRVTGRELAPTITFAERLVQAGVKVWVRFVLVPGLTDPLANIDKVARIASKISTLERLEVLPFHQMGRDKWDQLNMKYELAETEPPSNDLVNSVRDTFRSYGLPTF